MAGVADETWLPRVLGGYWYDIHQSEDVRVLSRARADLELWTEQRRDEAVLCLSSEDTPIYATRPWLPLKIRRPYNTPGNLTVQRYGDTGLVYGSAGVYGMQVVGDGFHVGLPAEVAKAPEVRATVSIEGTVWRLDKDYTHNEHGELVFSADPFFEEYGFAKTPYYEGNTPVGDELTLWLRNPTVARKYVQNHHGRMARVPDGDGLFYKEAVNAVLASAIRGTAEIDARRLLAAIAGVPVARRHAVISSVTRTTENLVINDGNEDYLCPEASEPLVATGDTVRRGEFLCDAVQLYQQGAVPPLTSLTLDGSLLSPQISSSLTFENTDKALTVTTVSGISRVEFEITGDAAADFWDIVHERGVAAGKTLAQLLDTRPSSQATTPPTAAYLPTTVNPLEFVCRNVLGSHGAIAVFKTASLGPNRLEPEFEKLLRRVVPSYATILSVYV